MAILIAILSCRDRYPPPRRTAKWGVLISVLTALSRAFQAVKVAIQAQSKPGRNRVGLFRRLISIDCPCSNKQSPDGQARTSHLARSPDATIQYADCSHMTKTTTTLDALPARAKTLIAGVTGHGAALIKARAIGLREGRPIEVIARSGRLILALVGNSRIALTLDLARHIQVRAL